MGWSDAGSGAATGAAVGSIVPGIGTIVGAGIGAAAGMFGSKKQSEAADAANKTTQQSNAATLKLAQEQEQERKSEFDQQQALQKSQWDAEQAQRAPYRAAGQQALGHLGDILGVNFGSGPATSSGPTQPSATSGPAPSVSAANGDISKQVAAYFASRGVTPNPTSVQYWADKWNEFGAKDPAYFNTRLSQADEFGGSGSAGTAGVVPMASLVRPPAPVVTPTGPATQQNYQGVIPLASLARGY